jgi:hypothetical protein
MCQKPSACPGLCMGMVPKAYQCIHLWVYCFYPWDTIPRLLDQVFVEGFTKDPSDARQVRDYFEEVVDDADV